MTIASRPREPGFTLLEILIALAVLAIALAAVVGVMGQAIDTSANLRERMLAQWVAEDRLTEHQMSRSYPPIDTTEGTAEMGGRRWRWQQQVSATPAARLRRIDIIIRAESGPDVRARLTGFVREP